MEKQRAIIIGVCTPENNQFENAMEELRNLAIACELEVVGVLEQNLRSPHPAYYIGTGKVSELKETAQMNEVEVLIFNNELSPSQLRNLEKKLECEILDKTALILEIFARRAKTKEAKMQVESAKLKYMLPRLAGLRSALGRQGGGSGVRNRGAGEKKIELDRRKIEQKITELDKEIDRIQSERETQSKKRSVGELPRVALAGYTNAGKSTVMNSLVKRYKKHEQKEVFEKDMLFATLETSVRSITLEDNKSFLLSDTVGFVSDLPHDLVKAFRSTLQEIVEADLVLHVVDVSNPNYKEQIKVTNDTLEQIGGDHLPTIYVYNKIDLAKEKDLQIQPDEEGIFISAKQEIGVEELLQCIREKIFTDYVSCRMFIPYLKGDIVSYLNEHATIQTVEYKEEGTLLQIECRQSDYNRYKAFVLSE
jgi:GTP-binding protein HflX